MVKGNPKSSATSATRKKHLKKHEQPDETPKEKKQKGKKGQKKEPRVKMYIPPVKPAPVQPDPLETTGLAHTLPADLLVVLRNISKKAQVTKTRALEDLQSGWVNQCLKDGKESPLVYTLVEMLPVWLHHVSALLINPSRRIRFLTASLHSTLLQIPPVREQIVSLLQERTASSQLENVLGTWCLATHDVDRSVAMAATRTWKEIGSTMNSDQQVNAFVRRVILDPSQVYADLNPQPPAPPAQPIASGKNRSGKATTSRKDEEDQSARSKQDEQEESEQDRRARLRIGGLGALRWILSSSSTLSEELQAFYSNPALWTILYHAETAPWVDLESFGFAQPNVRKAGWSLLQTLLTSQNDHLEPLIPTLSTAILRSAWVESDSNVQGIMWQPLLTFLKQFPQCWTMDANNRKEDKEVDDDSDEEEDEEKEKGPLEATTSSVANESSQAYREFLQFLRQGCSGSPMQGYPAVVIVVSTIPTSIITSPTSISFSELFAAFWEALDSRALSSLHRIAASAAFLSALLECVVFLIKRVKNDESSNDTQKALVRTHFKLVWEELSSKKLKVEDRAAARLLAQTLESLFNLDQALFQIAWKVLGQGIQSSVESEANSSLIAASLKVFYDKFKKGTSLRPYAETLMKSILETNIDKCEKILNASSQTPDGAVQHGFDVLVGFFDQFREGLFVEDSLAAKLDNLVSNDAYLLLSVSPSLLLAYLINRKDESKSQGIWHTLLTSIASGFMSGDVPDTKAIASLLDAAQHGRLPRYLKAKSGELDSVVGDLLERCLSGSEQSDNLSVLRQILLSSDYFVSQSGLSTFLQVIIAAFTSNVADVISGKQVSATTFDHVLNLIKATFGHVLEEPSLSTSLLPDVFLFGYLLPIFFGADAIETEVNPSQSNAAELWKQWLESATETNKTEMTAIISEKLKDIVKDTNMKVIPEDVLHMIIEKFPGFQVDLRDIFPSSTQLDSMLEELDPDAIDYSIAILESLIPPTSPSSSIGQSKTTDYRGFSSYARIVNGLLQAFAEERSLAKRNMWALRHFYALSIYAQDLLNVPSTSSNSPTFDDKVSPPALRDVVSKAKQISVYLFNSFVAKEDETWRRAVLNLLLNEKNGKEGLSQLQGFLLDVVGHSRSGDTTRDARILKLVLDPLFADGMDVPEADLWVQYARKIEKTAPQTSITIISAITSTGAEPPKLDRYRNELAAGLLGIKPSKANTEGLLSLRELAATAPNPDGDVIFLQPLRAINVIKACQAWVLAGGDDGDNELDEEVQSAMLPIFIHLAPILQNVQGGHWGFIFDVLEATLEGSSGEGAEDEESSVDEASRLLGLSRALRLVYVIEDLVKTNKGLMAEWEERRVGILTMIRDLGVIGSESSVLSSKPRSVCRELALSIVQHLPSSLIDENTLSKMCHLIEDPSPVVQKMTYQLLKAAAQKRTEHFVIEAGVDTEATVQATLPSELLEIVSRQMSFTGGDEEGGPEGESEEQLQNIFGYLLGWMLVFDLFQDASFKVRSSYIDQLRSLNLVLDHFIPCFLGMLRLDQGGLQKAFKLDIWAVDQFYVDLYQPRNPHTIPVLTAHVYYRSLLTIPSLIHSWVLDCKDRQLTNAVTNYTSTHFSPVLIRAELEHVRAHSTKDGLADDNLSIKVAPAVNEVVAAYSVDEHQLEIRLKVPGDWPLHRIEVRDVKRVGVDENRWRAWVLGVQQTIWSHNGRIIDGLGLFKKNVTLHFEGQVECAICYSIISVMDGTLPKKPCKTCKNRFHAGCLYKWFNTSHSSSCPLCRSDII